MWTAFGRRHPPNRSRRLFGEEGNGGCCSPLTRGLGVDALAGRLVLAGVAAEGDHRVAGVQQALWCSGETIPLRANPHEDAFQHGAGPRVRVSIGVEEIFRLPPL